VSAEPLPKTYDPAATEARLQDHHVEAVKGHLAIFPPGLSPIQRGWVSHTHTHTKIIATGWSNAVTRELDLALLAAS
jgi:hypothetical protein